MDTDEAIEQLEIGGTAQITPGVIVERRCFLKSVAFAFGSLSIPGVATAHLGASNDRLTYEEFLKEVVPVAKKLVSDVSLAGQQRYLLTLASYAVRMEDAPVPVMRDSGQGAAGSTLIGAIPGGDPFIVLHWRMEPGSVIRPHAHTYGNVMTIALEGEVRVENFEMVGVRDFDAKGTFKARRTQSQVLSPGQVNLVNLESGYVHGFQAGARGGRGLDITTRIKERRETTPYLKLANKPVEIEPGVYEATWST
jgi:quercetin dioxygenase-like cupin family protein